MKDYNPCSCLNPKIICNKFTGELVSVPCGKCSACLTKRTALWTARLREESTCHSFCLFVTLTYDDAHLPVLDLNSLEPEKLALLDDSIQKSASYVNFCNGKIPCLNVSDYQKFFKLLRYYIEKNHGTQTKLRYFLCGEYGPTTYRPHCHMLLWFDEPALVPHIKEYIYKAWKSKTNYSSLSEFLHRNKCKFVHGHAESYVAGYLNMFAHLPEILQQKPFRPFHLHSSAPPIGTIRIFKDTIRELLSGNVSTVALNRQSTGDVITVPLWRDLENRLFPKCIGFSRVSSRDRVALYYISRFFPQGIERENFDAFSKRFLPKWNSSNYTCKLVRRLCSHSEAFCEPDTSAVQSLHRLYNCSRLFFKNSAALGVSTEYMLSAIEAYYSRKEYNELVAQLDFQERLSNSSRDDASLSYYPFLIDQLFYENLRKLPFRTHQSYLRQFGLGQVTDYKFIVSRSHAYKLRRSLTDKIYHDNHKTKINKDYVANHPECYLNYISLLKPFTY